MIKTCEHCNKQFSTKTKTLYCSKQCKESHKNIQFVIERYWGHSTTYLSLVGYTKHIILAKKFPTSYSANKYLTENRNKLKGFYKVIKYD